MHRVPWEMLVNMLIEDDTEGVKVLTGAMYVQVCTRRRDYCTYAAQDCVTKWRSNSSLPIRSVCSQCLLACLACDPDTLACDFQVEDAAAQSLKVQVRDSHLTGRTVLGHVTVPLRQLPADCTLDAWLPVEGVDGGRAGEVHLQLTYKARSPLQRLHCPGAHMRAC